MDTDIFLLALSAVVAGFALFSSIYQTIQIRKLAKKIKELKERMYIDF